MASEGKTKCKACGREVVQVSGGHRQREYCDDACKHVALRRRQEDQRKEEIRQRWAGFTSETQTYLDWLMSRSGEDHAQGVATAIKRELGQLGEQHAQEVKQLREKQLSRVEKLQARIAELGQEVAECKQRMAEKPQPRAVLSAEQARERAKLHGYLDEGSYLASTQRLFVRLFQTGQVEPNEIREVIHQERGAKDDRLRHRIAELEQELAQRSPVEEQNIRRMEQYAIDCSLDARQAKERITTLEVEVASVSQGRDQVQARFAEYVRSTNEKLSGLTGELAKLRQQEQERKSKPGDQQNVDSYREKLTQAGTRIEKLERQVDVQRQQLGQYHQRFYPSSLAVAAQRLMTLGAAINYKLLLKYDSQAVEIKSGEDAWREFASHASYEDVAQAILQAQHFFDNLQALGMLGKRDAPGGRD
jgi:chromosome segregation ATPase